MTKHQKHTNLTRRKHGVYATNEVAILGAKCSIISDLVLKVARNLSRWNLAYFDASHAKEIDANILSEFTFHHEGNLIVLSKGPVNEYVQRIQFSQFDFVFINGNHYSGEKQIVLLHPEKEASINKRIDQINDIQFFVKLESEIEPFDVIKSKFPNWREIPQYQIEEEDYIIEHISQIVMQAIPLVKGLVLAGGKSTRMGKDKSQLDYHGKAQKEVVRDLLERQGLQTFFSVQESIREYEIGDKFFNLGPFGGICSAFQKDPNSAWFALATDLPFINQELIELLISKRNPSKVATAVKGRSKQFPEPLITIYEPKAYPVLLQFLAQGYSCPRKMLINSDIEIVKVDDALIRNVNTPEEFKLAKQELS